MSDDLDLKVPPKAPREWGAKDVADAFIDSAIAVKDEGIDVLSWDPWQPFDLHDISWLDEVTQQFYVGKRRFVLTVVEVPASDEV
jgi:hypothetical protein